MTFWNSLSDDVQLLTVIALFCLPIVLMIAVFTWQDAKRRGMNRILWTCIAGLSPALVGFIIYLLVRSTYSRLVCTGCGHSVTEADAVCANCGANLKPQCPSCGNAVEECWNSCPHCAAALTEPHDLTPTARPRSKALWAILAMLIVIPVLLAYFVGYFVLGDTNPRYFHTRYTPDLSANEGPVDPALLTADTWFLYTYTDGGQTTTVARESNGFGNSYTVTQPDGTEESWSAGGNSSAHHLDGTTSRFFRESNGSLGDTIYGDATNTYDQDGVLTSITLRIGQMVSSYNSKPLYQVKLSFTYDDTGRLIRQESIRLNPYTHTYLPEESTRRYVAYTYDDSGHLVLAEEFDHTDTLTGCTIYSWAMDGRVRIAQSYTADGTQGSRSVAEFDRSGDLLRLEIYESGNSQPAVMEFDRNLATCLTQPGNLFKLALVWAMVLFFSGAVIFSANKESY